MNRSWLNASPLSVSYAPFACLDYSNYATMRFNPEALHAANNGLAVARGVLEPVKKEFPWISYGDLWTLAGVAAIQVGHTEEFMVT